MLVFGMPQLVQAAPIALIGRDTAIYRFNADGNGLMEVFPNQVGMIVGITRVPPGVALSGCNTGDVIANEGGPASTRRIWRIDNASCGTPTLVQIGQLSHGPSSIAFANGRFFGIGSATVFREFSPVTFQQIGSPVTLSLTAHTGGLSFDGIDSWYALGGVDTTDRLFKFADPPNDLGLVEVGDPGIGVGDCGLEFWGSSLWGAFRGPSDQLYVGTFDLQSGIFTTQWQRSQIGTHTLGIAILPEISAIEGDINCDGKSDGLDVAPFVLALTNPIAFGTDLPECNVLNADLTADCTVNESDIQPFVDTLLGS